MTRILLMLRGLPASGKSTYAKELVAKGERGPWKRVNKDDLRAMLDNGRWSKQNENLVITLRDAIIWESLMAGFHVVVDDTNLAPKHEIALKAYVDQFNRYHAEQANAGKNPVARFEVKDFDVTPKICIQRDLKRENSVGSKVIMQMYRQFVAPLTRYIPPEGKPAAIICDIDGTLAHMNGRSPYDYSLVLDDWVDFDVKHLLESDEYISTTTILLSGRPETTRTDTVQWLVENDIRYDYLFMRPEGDKRPDYIVKQELFDKHIRDNYQVSLVLDDRNQVVDMWRALGLKVWQVAEGDF